MFCEKCGRPIPDGQSSCGFCNPPSQEPLRKAPQFQRAPMDLSDPAPAKQETYIPPVQEPLYQPPVQEPVYQPPVQEPVYQPPVQEPVYQPPVQQPVYQQPVQQPNFNLNMPTENNRKPKKKKGAGGKIALIIIALLLVAGVVLTIINWNSISLFFNRHLGSPADYMHSVEKAGVSDVASDVAKAYDKALGYYYPEGSSVNGTIKLEANDLLISALSTILAESGAPINLDWVESIALSPNFEVYEETMRMDLGLGVNDTSLATVSFVWDMESQTILVGVPELHKTFIEMDAEEVLGEEAVTAAQAMILSRELTASMMEAMPEGKQLESLINKYAGIVIDGISEVEKATETVKVDDLEQDLVVLTSELSQKDILEIALSLLEEAQDDKDIEKILDNFNDCIDEMSELYGSESVDLNDAFADVIDEGIENLEYMIDEADKGTFLTIETFVDNESNIVGRELTVEVEDEEMSIHYVTITEDDKFAFDAEAATISISGDGTIKDGKRTGSFTFTESGVDYAIFEIENYSCSDEGQITGTFRLIPEDDLLEMMDLDSAAASVLAQAALELTLDGESVTIGIESAGTDLVSFVVTGESTAPSKISLPDGIDPNDDNDAMKWVSELDLEAVVDNLEKAGVPAEYMEMAEALVEMFRGEFG